MYDSGVYKCSLSICNLCLPLSGNCTLFGCEGKYIICRAQPDQSGMQSLLQVPEANRTVEVLRPSRLFRKKT